MTLRLAALLLVVAAAILGAALWLVREADERPVIAVADAWTRPSSGADEAAAVYLEIDNSGDADDELTGAQTPVAAKAEIHSHQIEGHIAEMRAVASVDIHPDEHIAFAPGGLHFMLTGLNRKLGLGDHFPLTLEFGKAGPVTVDVAVMEKALTPGGQQSGDRGMENMPMGGPDHGAAAHP